MPFNLSKTDGFNGDVLKETIAYVLAETTPVMRHINFFDIAGDAFKYNVQRGISGVGFRGYNQSLNESNLVLNQKIESLKVLQGSAKVDRAILKTRTNKEAYKAGVLKDKLMGMSYEFTRSFFIGDSAVDPDGFDGLRVRLTGKQVIDAAGALTLDHLDALLLAVAGPNALKKIYMGAPDYATFLKLTREGGTVIEKDNFGSEVIKYRNAEIHLIEPFDIINQESETEEHVDVLGKNETNGATQNTSSMYCVRYGEGEDYVTGIMNSSGLDVDPNRKEGQYIVTDVEWIAGFGIFNGRAAARLKGIV